MGTLGGFQLHQRIGRGRRSEVHLARDPAGTIVVIKKLLAATDPALADSILKTARMTQEIVHPGLAAVLAVGDHPIPYVAVEYVHGETIAAILERYSESPILPLLAARIVADAASALHHAHEVRDEAGEPAGLVHAGLCPENVFVTYDGQVKVTDIGWAARAADVGRMGGAEGVSRYMSPEQAIGARVDRRTDVFALGILLWELLTGDKLFESSSPADLVSKITIDEIPDPRTRNPEIPERLVGITLGALTRSLVKRTPTAAALKAELSLLLTDDHEALGTYMRSAFADRRRDREAVLREVREDDRALAAPAEKASGPLDSIILDPDLLESIPTPVPPQPVPPPRAPAMPSTPAAVIPAPRAAPAGAAVPSVTAGATSMADLPDDVSFSSSRAGIVIVLGLVILGGAAAVVFRDRLLGSTESAEPILETGAILVRSNPEGARIEMDGADTGKRTPARFEGLALGTPHEVRLVLAGRRPWEESIRATAGQGHSVHAMLAPDVPEPPAPTPPPEPDAEPPVTRTGSAPRRSAPVQEGGDPEHSSAASNEMGFLSVSTDVRALVSFDGRSLGRAPLFKVRVPAGSHRVRVQFEGADSQVREARVQIRPGWEFTLRVRRE